MTVIFVFGSNLSGRHGKGAALIARKKYGAIYGQARGLQGRSYAIPTKDGQLNSLPLHHVAASVATFIEFATAHPELIFEISHVGCGLAGFTPDQIGPLFANAPPNCVIPAMFDLSSLQNIC